MSSNTLKDEEVDIEMPNLKDVEEEEEVDFGTFDLEEDTRNTGEQSEYSHSKSRVSGGFYGENLRSQSYQNSTMTFFDRKSKRFASIHYSSETRSKWLNNQQITHVTIWDRICFYTNSLYNNKMNKFKFIEYMGELTMMYEHSNKLMTDIMEMEKEEQNNESVQSKDPLYFLYEADDDISNSFRRIDVFLRRHIQFMRLCSAPVDLFLDNYYSARANSCGLIEMFLLVNTSCIPNKKSHLENTFYVHHSECLDEDLQKEFLTEMRESYFEGSDRLYSTNRRVAALRNILGELHAISEFIKTTVEMNDQLLFRLLMLFGSFLTVLGEYVWNTQMKQYHYE